MQTIELENFCDLLSSKFLHREFTRKEVVETLGPLLPWKPATIMNNLYYVEMAGYIKVTQEKKHLGYGVGLKAGKYQLISAADPRKISKVKKDSQREKRKERGINVERSEKPTKRKQLELMIDEDGIDLASRIYGFADVAARRLNTTRGSIQTTIKEIRKDRNVNAPPKKVEVSESIKIPFVDYLLKNNFDRGMPGHERNACDKMIYAIIDILPRGGAGMMIGTQEPFGASTVPNYCNQLLTDELEVACFLNRFTDKEIPLTIVVGNLFHEGEQAKIKADHWRSNNSTHDAIIKVDRVDRDSYTHYVSTFAKAHHVSKVVLITGGTWGYCDVSRKKYNGHDFNFKDPSEYLTSKVYRNLHILALTMKDNCREFDVRYLHDGKNEIL